MLTEDGSLITYERPRRKMVEVVRHRWTTVLLADMMTGRAVSKPGWAHIQKCCNWVQLPHTTYVITRGYLAIPLCSTGWLELYVPISGGFSSSLPLVSGFGSSYLSVTVFALSHIRLLIPPFTALSAEDSPGRQGRKRTPRKGVGKWEGGEKREADLMLFFFLTAHFPSQFPCNIACLLLCTGEGFFKRSVNKSWLSH